MPLDYRQVKDLYDTLHGAGVVTDTLPSWSTEMNRLTGSDLYNAGLNDNFIKRSSVAIDRLLESTGLPKITGEFGRAFGETLGAPEAGERVGAGLPRMAVNFAPLAIPGPGWATAAGLGLTGLLSGAQTYTETGSPAAGLLSGATAAITPGVAGAAERGALALLGARRVAGPLADAAGNIVGQADKFYPTMFQNLLSKGAGQAAAAGTFGVSGAGQELLAGEPVRSPFTVENLLNLTLGQAPFALAHLGGRAIRGRGAAGPTADELQHAVDVSTNLINKRQAKEQLIRDNPIEALPDVKQEATPEVLVERDKLLAQVRGEQAKISTDPNLTDEQKVAQTDALVKQESDILQQHEITTGSSVLGDSIRQDSPRQEVTGTEVIRTKNKKYRAILVSDDPSNPEELRGKIVGYSTAYETPPTEAQQKGQKVFNLPGSQWQTVKTKDEWNSRFVKVTDPNQPELPAQNRPATDEERNAHIVDLNKVQVEADAAQTPVDLQKSVVRMQGVQQENDLSVTNDAKLRKRSIQLSKKIEDPTEVTKAAVKAEAKKTQREIERAVAPLSPRDAANVSALMEGDEEANAGFSIITADKLSHTKPEEFEDIPINNLVTETAAQTVQGQAGRDAFEAWFRKGHTTLGQDAQLFHTLVDEFGSIKDVKPDEIADYLTSIGNMSAAEAKSEVEDFLQRPHVKVWDKELDARLSTIRSGNAEPIGPLYHGTQAQKVVGDHYEPVTLEDLQPTVEKPLFTSFDKTGAGYTRGEKGQVIQFHVDGKFATPEEVTQTAEKAGLSNDALIQQDESTHKLVKALNEADFDGAKYFDQHHDTGDLIDAVVVWNKDSIVKEQPNLFRSPDDNVPFVPQSPADEATIKAIGNDGHSAVAYLAQSNDPVIRALANDLSKFTDSLGRISVSVAKTRSGSSRAYNMGGGRTSIFITHGRLGNQTALEFSLSHELVHGLTITELDNPAKANIVRQLDDLRSRLIDALPKDQKAIVNNAIDNGLYGQYARGEIPIQRLFPGATQNQTQVLYALLTTHEMVAQGLSSYQFQSFMRNIKAEKGVTWFSRFTNTIKSLLGIGVSIPNSTFGEFLSKTDQLLEQGNFVSSFSDFSDRYFENLGLSKNLVDINTRKALNVVLNSNESTTSHEIVSRLADTGQVYSPDFYSAYYKADTMFNRGGPDTDQAKQVLGEIGYPGRTSGLDDFTHEVLQGLVPVSHLDAIDLLPKAAQDFIFTKAKDVQDILGVLKAATDAKNKGLLNLADPSILHGPVRRAEKLVSQVMSARAEWQQSEQLVHQMGNIAPDAFAVSDHVEPALEPVAEAFVRDSTARKERGLGWFLNPVAQIARAVPQAREVLDAAFRLESNARQYFGQTLKPMGLDFREGSNQLTGDVVKANIKLLRNPKTFNAINSWMAENNYRAHDEERGVTLLPETDAGVQKFLSGLSPTERADVSEFVKNQGVMTQVEHLQALNYMLKIGSSRAGIIVMKDQPTYKSFQATELVDRAFKALLADKTNPVAMQEASAQLNVVQSKMTPEGFVDLLKYGQAEIENYNNWKGYYEQNPYWNTAQRQEKYLVRFKNNEGFQNLQASSTKEANEIFKKYRGIGVPEIVENFKGRNDEFPSLGPDIAELSQRMKELQDTQVAIMKDKVSPEALDAMVKYSPTTQILREAAGEGGGIPKFATPPRLLSQGAEKLPWFWNHISYMQRRSNYWTRQLLRAKSDLLLNDPDMLSNPELASNMKQHIDNMLQPDPQLTRKLNRFTSTWFMGFAPASAMVNGMQTLSTLVPELTNLTGKAIHSYGTWKNAVTDTLEHYIKGGGKVWKEKEVDDLMRFAEQAGGIGFSMWDEEAQTHEQIAMGFKQAMMKDKPQNLAQRLSTAAGVWSTAGMWMFKNVEMFNQRVATIAAYRTYRELGSSIPEAQQQALELNRAVNYGGGRAGRPIGLYAGTDSFTRGAAMLASNMQNYNLGVVSQLGRFLQQGFFRPGDLKPSEVFAARKAALQMLSTQLGAAGLLGLPFASGAVALLNQMFPSLELNKKLRETVSDFFSSDKANGSILSDAALTGLPSMLGWDMQSRLSMGNITPGVSEYNGFQPGLLLGPPANLVTNFVNGALQVVQGEPHGAAAFIPPGLKKLTQYVTGDQTLKDYKGRPLFTPTLGETAGLALGFNPKRLSDLNAASRMADQTTQVANRREGQFRQEQAAEVLKGNFGNVRQELLARSQADKNYDPTESVRAIAKAAEDLSFPRDLQREGTRRTDTSRSRLLSTFNITPQLPSEMDRFRFRQQVEQRLGLRTQDQGAVQLATVMDRLRQQNPDASRVELRRQAGLMLHGARQTPSLLLETP